jgi:hypothetical protein
MNLLHGDGANLLANKSEGILHNIKLKVKFSLCLTKHNAMKTYRGAEVQLHTSWMEASGQLHAISFTPGKEPPLPDG